MDLAAVVAWGNLLWDNLLRDNLLWDNLLWYGIISCGMNCGTTSRRILLWDKRNVLQIILKLPRYLCMYCRTTRLLLSPSCLY